MVLRKPQDRSDLRSDQLGIVQKQAYAAATQHGIGGGRQAQIRQRLVAANIKKANRYRASAQRSDQAFQFAA